MLLEQFCYTYQPKNFEVAYGSPHPSRKLDTFSSKEKAILNNCAGVELCFLAEILQTSMSGLNFARDYINIFI